MEKPRILFIATFPPPIHGSALVSEQIRNSKKVNELFDGDYVNLGLSRSIDEIGNSGLFLSLKKIFRFIGIFFKIFILLLTHKYDICYCAITCRGLGFIKDVPFVLLCKIFRRKVVVHQHNKGMSDYVNKPIYRFLYKLVYKKSKVILLSWHLYSDIEQIVKKENVLICPNGIKPTVHSKFNRDGESAIRILYLSNLMIDKGILVLLDSLKIIKEKGYSFFCDFVGSETKDIDEFIFSEEVSKRNLSDNVIYHGRKYGKEKVDFFRRAQIFVLPSFNEAFPLVNIEAMEYSLPIISTRVGGIPDEVINGVNGYIIEPKDVSALSESLEKLLVNSNLRKEMGEAGRKLFEEKYTEDIFEKRLVECLLSVI